MFQKNVWESCCVFYFRSRILCHKQPIKKFQLIKKSHDPRPLRPIRSLGSSLLLSNCAIPSLRESDLLVRSRGRQNFRKFDIVERDWKASPFWSVVTDAPFSPIGGRKKEKLLQSSFLTWLRVQILDFPLIGHETKDNINLYPDKLPGCKCDLRNRSDFLLALNASLAWFLHKTLKDEQELVTYIEKKC